MNLKVDEHLSIGYFLPEDVEAFAKYANDITLYHNTLRVPYPYTRKDAEEWVGANIEKQMGDEPLENFTIRFDNSLIGGIGHMPCGPYRDHTVEIGYWLAGLYRGKGLMKKAVAGYCQRLFENPGITKIIAHVFVENIASRKLLENNGFMLEGILKDHYKKGERMIDCALYGLYKPY